MSELKPYYQKDFVLGEYEAFLVYGPDVESAGFDQMLLIFGDNDYQVMVLGEVESNDSQTAKEILSALLTAYVDKSAIPDYTSVAAFTMDISHSDFKYHSNNSSIFNYTVNGKAIDNNTNGDQIMVVSFPPLRSLDERKRPMNSIIQRQINAGMSIDHAQEKALVINGLNAYELTFSGTVKGQQYKSYAVVLGNNNATVVFQGVILANQDKLFRQCQDIAQSLKIK
jgi:hypothetical protein